MTKGIVKAKKKKTKQTMKKVIYIKYAFMFNYQNTYSYFT